MSKQKDYEIGSGNVLRDLGLPNADELQVKANLAFEIAKIISERGMNQATAATALGVDQPKVSAIIRGHLEKFSVERLCNFLTRLGCDVNIQVQPGKRPARGKIRVQIASA
jgi:predicted XRE-type DNA-binding protein